MPFLSITLTQLIFAFTMLPVVQTQLKKTDITISGNAEVIFSVVAVFSSTIMGLFTFILGCLVFFFIGKIFQQELQLRYVVSMLGFEQIPKNLKLLLLAGKVSQTGIIPVKKGLASVINTGSPLLNAFYGNIDLFNLWSLFLLGIVIHVLLKTSWKKSYLLVAGFFAIEVLVQSIMPGVLPRVPK
ncbi:YIP1 family protein [Carboxydocella sp. ULO1]|nr:YIP1 family protein [Carboxydocella sp. ULO1]